VKRYGEGELQSRQVERCQIHHTSSPPRAKGTLSRMCTPRARDQALPLTIHRIDGEAYLEKIDRHNVGVEHDTAHPVNIAR
jgi:hypothetical protein